MFATAALAQAGDQLRAQVRADLMQDPRSAEMTDVEIEAMVDTIVQEAEASGAAADYLESRSTFDYSALFAPPKEPSALMRVLLSPLSLAIALLLLVLFAVMYYIVRRGTLPEEADSA